MRKTCRKCGEQVRKNYCSRCGTPTRLPRVDGRYIWREIASILNLDRRIVYTVKELLLRPGMSVRGFLHEDRDRLVKPIVFIVLTSLIYMLARYFFPFVDPLFDTKSIGEPEDSIVVAMFEWIQSNYGYANMLMAGFVAGWIRLLFRKQPYNYSEIIVLLCYVMGMSMLFDAIFGLVGRGLRLPGATRVGSLLGILYISWGIACFFDRRKKWNYFKGFVAYQHGLFCFIVVAVSLAVVFEDIRGL